MAPEQAAGDPSTDHRADIYALGVVAFELLVGRSPFAGRSPTAMLAAHAVEAVPRADILRPRVPRALADLVERCLEKHPVDRPQTALEVLRSLESPASLRDERGVARRLLRRATGWRAAAVIVVAALLAGALARPIRARAAAPRTPISFAGVTTSGPDSVLAAVLAEFARVRLGRSPSLRLTGSEVASVVAVVDGRVTRHASGSIGLALAAHDPVTGEPIAALRELARAGDEMAAIERLDDRFAELLAGALRRESPAVPPVSRR
jgi:hypothetical protein